MDDNSGEWVESIGLASGCGEQEAGVVSGWNLWVWLECIGVVSGCCCKEVHRFPINITYPYSNCISSFFTAASLYTYFFVHFKMVFSFLVQWNLC